MSGHCVMANRDLPLFLVLSSPHIYEGRKLKSSVHDLVQIAVAIMW